MIYLQSMSWIFTTCQESGLPLRGCKGSRITYLPALGQLIRDLAPKIHNKCTKIR